MGWRRGGNMHKVRVVLEDNRGEIDLILTDEEKEHLDLELNNFYQEVPIWEYKTTEGKIISDLDIAHYA